MTPQQQQEARKFKYQRSYLKWLEIAEKLGYSTVTVMLEDLYKKRSVYDMANLVGRTQMSVFKTMRKLGVQRRLPVSKNPLKFAELRSRRRK